MTVLPEELHSALHDGGEIGDPPAPYAYGNLRPGLPFRPGKSGSFQLEVDG